MDLARMHAQLILHEGLRLVPYLDTAGKWTIGVGYNFSDRGLGMLEHVIGRSLSRRVPDIRLTREEALKMLDHDILRVERGVCQYLPVYDTLNDVRQRVCVDMAFNMGLRALGFKQTIRHVIRGEFEKASVRMMQSKWANDVGDGPGKQFDRAERLSQMMRTGEDFKS